MIIEIIQYQAKCDTCNGVNFSHNDEKNNLTLFVRRLKKEGWIINGNMKCPYCADKEKDKQDERSIKG